jgi:hypothetical protein
MRALLSLVLVAIAFPVSTPAHAMEGNLPITLAQAAKKPPAEKTPPADLGRYSWRFWPKNTLRTGQVVSTDTPYGRLTCRAVSHSILRECWLSPR